MLISRINSNIDQLFSALNFEEARHLYYKRDRNGIRYLPSVSSKVEHYVPPFDEAYWLPRCARKEGMSEVDLARKWQLINETACELGHKTHSFLEKFDGFKQPNSPQETAGINFLKSLGNRYVIIRKELRMFHHIFMYAGTMDLLLYDTETNTLIIADYKTNGDLFKTFGMMNSPFNYLESHPYNHYQIQLSLYQILLQQLADILEIEISERWIIHLNAIEEFKVYKTNFFDEELLEELNSKLLAA
jgi:hypothetical protein